MMQNEEKAITEAIKALNAKNEQSAKALTEISAKCSRPRGVVSNALDHLSKSGKVSKLSKDGKSLYYIPGK